MTTHTGPQDFREPAVAVIDFIVDTYDEPATESPHELAGRKGGHARARAMTSAERSASARRAAQARWARV